MDSKHGDKSNDKHSKRNDRGNIRHLRRDPETIISQGIVAPTKKLKSSSFGSHSSPDYSSEDFIQEDTKEIFKSSPSTSTSPNVVHPLPKYYKIDVSDDIFYKSEHDSGSFSRCTSQVSDLTHESLLHSTSLTESPPIQVMERPVGFVSNRIPSSVFASKSPIPMEWSITSNESLFSIHIGNASFSKDHVLKLSGEILKSGELQKFEESYKSSELFSLSSPSIAVREMESERKNVNMGTNFGETRVADKKIKDTPMETANDQCREKIPAQELPFDRHSYGNGTCIQSHTFPKKKKHGWSLCYCFSCSCGFCSFTRPSFNCCKWASCRCCKWPACSCCKWTSCNYCCKWTSCNFCKCPTCSCCKWPSCSCFTSSSGSCCKLLSCMNCRWLSCSTCKWPSCNCCKWPSCSCCKWPSCNCSTWPSCNCCKWPSCRCCSWPSCSYFKCSSCSCCKWPSYSCSTCPSCYCCCCKWPSYPSCNMVFCCGWNSKQKIIFCCSSKM